MDLLDLTKLENARSDGARKVARCPACAEIGADKKGEHLVIYKDGRFGCVINPGPEGAAHRRRILELVGLHIARPDLSKPRSARTKSQTLDEVSAWTSANLRMRETHRYIYREVDGRECFVVIRFGDDRQKAYRPFHKNGAGWLTGDPSTQLWLFNLPELSSRLTERVFVVEGEKCACELASLNVLTTTSAHGANSAHKSDWTPLAGREVVILPDNDADGYAYAETVANIVSKLSPPARVRIVKLPDLPEHGDIADWLDRRDSQLPDDILFELHKLVRAAPSWIPKDGNLSPFAELPPENDAGNARLFIDRFGQSLRFVPAFDSWLIWRGTNWKHDEDGEIRRRAVELSQMMLGDAAKIIDHSGRNRIAERGIRLGNAAKIRSMLDLARCDMRVVVPHSKLDADPWLLGVQNGVIELRNGTFRPGTKEDLITKTAGCAYDRNASASRWQQFVREIFDDDTELIVYVQKLVGYTLTGSTCEQLFLFLHGDGANGKTTFIEIITALLGDYAQRATQTLLAAADNGREPMNEIARLHGARFVVSSETREGDRLAENRIKDMTGGDTLTGRFLYCESFDFIPTLKLWMFGNHRPEIRGTDRGIWRRVRLIPFNVQIPESKRDRNLQDKLREQLPGILSWAVEGCLLWQHDGLTPPAAVKAATTEYRKDEDVLRDFLVEETECDDGSRVDHAELYDRYKSWCGRSGVRFPMQSKTFSKRLGGRGYRRERTGRGTRWAGIKLK